MCFPDLLKNNQNCMEEDMKKLIKAVHMLSKLCAPVVFKYTSAAGVSTDQMKEMQNSINELHDKYC